MSAKYFMQEMNDLNNEGKTLLYPRMELQERCCLTELAERVAAGSTYGVGEVKGIILQMTSWMSWMMAQGRPVKIDGIGTFTPALELKEGKERERADGSGTKRNAMSIKVGNINFRADKELIRETDRLCRLERSKKKSARHVSRYTPEERLAQAKKYLALHQTMNIGAYCAITGLGRGAAGKELKRWSETPDSGIGTSGWGTHKVYVLKSPGA